MSEAPAILEQLKSAGLSGDIYRCHVRFWPASKMTEQQYQTITDSIPDLVDQLALQETENHSTPSMGSNYQTDPDLAGYKMKTLERRVEVGEDFYLWPIPADKRAELGCRGPDPEGWRPYPLVYATGNGPSGSQLR